MKHSLEHDAAGGVNIFKLDHCVPGADRQCFTHIVYLEGDLFV